MQDTEALTAPILVTDDQMLNLLCERWKDLSALALDTEFIRINTFYPKPGLIQVCDGQHSYLLDPLAISDWQAFTELLVADDIVKVLHSCSEDLVLFYDFFGEIPAPLFDTQKAAAFLGYGYSISYQNLVRELEGIEVPKGETRSDWLRRPLTARQLSYAGLDVAYLPRIYEDLRTALEKEGRLSCLMEECEQMRRFTWLAENPDSWKQLYLTMGAAWRLSALQLAVLQALLIWREQQARRRNKPRSWIVKDSDLLLLAEQLPQDVAALETIQGISRSLDSGDKRQLVEVIAGSMEHEVPANLTAVSRPLTPQQRRLIKKCQAVVRRRAAETGIAEELLARKKLLIQLVEAYEQPGKLSWPADLSGWRRDILGEELEQVLAGADTGTDCTAGDVKV